MATVHGQGNHTLCKHYNNTYNWSYKQQPTYIRRWYRPTHTTYVINN